MLLWRVKNEQMQVLLPLYRSEQYALKLRRNHVVLLMLDKNWPFTQVYVSLHKLHA